MGRLLVAVKTKRRQFACEACDLASYYGKFSTKDNSGVFSMSWGMPCFINRYPGPVPVVVDKVAPENARGALRSELGAGSPGAAKGRAFPTSHFIKNLKVLKYSPTNCCGETNSKNTF